MYQINNDLEKKFASATEQAKKLLRDVSSLSKEQQAGIIRRYVAAIEGNFVSWMGATAISARSVEGRYAAEENLYVEMKDDHAGMLRSFAKSANAEPTKEDYQYVNAAVSKIRKLVSQLSGVQNLALMATLENTSAAFVPYLANIAKNLGSKDLKYTDVHGVADIEHAQQFIWALDKESMHYDNASEKVDETISETLDFLRTIFI